jgi:methylmalonyl-CoA mutase N-terminal domain/subunit
LGGAFSLEALTDEREEGFWSYLDRLEKMGGMVRCIETGFFQREIADSSYEWQKQVESNETIVVGVNRFRSGDDWIPTKLLKVEVKDMEEQINSVSNLKDTRDKRKAQDAMNRIRKDVEKDANLMPGIVDAVKAYVTVGEVCDLLRDLYGDYQELIVI